MKIYSRDYIISENISRKIIEYYRHRILDKSIYFGRGYIGFTNNKRIIEINTLSKNRNQLIKAKLEDEFNFKLKTA
ncbi:hypothetical protein CMI49_01200 [Candidatus Pacearchaeota archaeon]|jgi:hypothetical protein|nr:hypothetical protein [Candidatus Pacearchaeota archaeon]|tara:strand:- start:1013 stop:1240 length:228 start_codon:yes stop_codon:yes gene_type:complete